MRQRCDTQISFDFQDSSLWSRGIPTVITQRIRLPFSSSSSVGKTFVVFPGLPRFDTFEKYKRIFFLCRIFFNLSLSNSLHFGQECQKATLCSCWVVSSAPCSLPGCEGTSSFRLKGCMSSQLCVRGIMSAVNQPGWECRHSCDCKPTRGALRFVCLDSRCTSTALRTLAHVWTAGVPAHQCEPCCILGDPHVHAWRRQRCQALPPAVTTSCF